jgi:hypothetical protein
MRFYFDISDISDVSLSEIGSAATSICLQKPCCTQEYLAANLRCLEHEIRPRLSIQVIGEGRKQIHEEGVFG